MLVPTLPSPLTSAGLALRRLRLGAASELLRRCRLRLCTQVLDLGLTGTETKQEQGQKSQQALAGALPPNAQIAVLAIPQK